MIKAAITGNIGMGKSNALRAFQELGALTLSADEIVSELLEDPRVLQDIRFFLGDAPFEPDGTLNRQRTADIIFTDADLRKAVEGILHPLVMRRVDEAMAASDAALAVVEVPMLFEGSFEGRFDHTITVYSDENLAVDRLLESGMPREDVIRRMGAQMPITDKISRSHFTIDNNGGPDDLKVKVKQIHRALTGGAS